MEDRALRVVLVAALLSANWAVKDAIVSALPRRRGGRHRKAGIWAQAPDPLCDWVGERRPAADTGERDLTSDR